MIGCLRRLAAWRTARRGIRDLDQQLSALWGRLDEDRRQRQKFYHEWIKTSVRDSIGPRDKDESQELVMNLAMRENALCQKIMRQMMTPRYEREAKTLQTEVEGLTQRADARFNGLLPIANCGSSKRSGDVVFIHGLDGDGVATWCYDRDRTKYWPQWLGEYRSDLGIWSVGYPAKSRVWHRHEMCFERRARNILESLAVDGLGRRPLVFICHSLGGLLVKQMLQQAVSASTNPSDQPTASGWQGIQQKTRGIAFLGTPHFGSPLAARLQVFAPVLRLTPLVKTLMPTNLMQRRLERWFRKNARQKMQLLVFIEDHPLKGIIQIVPPWSGDSGIPGVEAIPIDEDHIGIAKPKSREHLVYKSVKSFIDGVLP